MVSDRIQRRIDRLLDEVEQAADERDWKKVQTLAQDVLDLDSDNGDAATFYEVASQNLSRIGTIDESGLAELSSETIILPNDSSDAQPVVVQPQSFANGRYTVSRFLGEGGKKRVYLAQDTLLDRDVAFALIKTEGLDDVARTRISREAQAMGRLGSHPHIVTVFDLGDHEGQPFMVTELMGGGDVEAIIEDAPEHRLSLEQAIRIAVETCRGLEFAHSRGIVHRDLKPGNVWLTEDGTAKIGDFGLAVATDRSRLTQEGMMVGTVSYMPPEQAMGGETTAQADLYSLGAMLYEMVAGRPPFLGDDNIAIIGQHINTPPVAPTWHRPDCPKPLEALILRLLAKNPAERPESASDVLTALEGIDLSTPTQAPDSDETEANVLDSLAGGVFVGRHAEMGELKAALEDALSGRGRMLTLVGEPGIGKTRTSQELATYANLRGAQVLWGRCYEEKGVPPYWPWVQAIRSYVAEREPEELASIMGSGAADIAEIVSDLRARLPGLQSPPALDNPDEARFRLFDSITSFLKNASRVQPIMLVLDDLHWADKPSLMLLQFVTRELSGTRLLLMGTYRDVELNRQHPLAETLGDLTRERLFQRILLRGLTQEDVGRFIETTSGIYPPAGLVQAVHTQTEGNPLFVTEVVRLLVQEGELTADKVGERDSWTVRIPEGVREVIGRRLNQLSQRCNETLTMASVIGREFELRQLDRLVEDQTEDMLLDVLEEGLSARVIEELPATVGRYQFTHALIQETLSEELSLTRRVRLHARIAEMLEELYGDAADSYAVELAHHYAQAETLLGNEKLLRYSFIAGQRALENYAYEDAIGILQRAVGTTEAQPLNDQAAGILFVLGRAQQAMRLLDDARENLTRAFDYYIENGDEKRAVEVAISIAPGSYSSLLGSQIIPRALELAEPDSREAGYLLARYGSLVGSEQKDYEGAREAFEMAIAIGEREGDTALLGQALASASNVAGNNLYYEVALEYGLRAIELAMQSGDAYAESLARLFVASAYRDTGDLERARQHTEANIAAAERIRAPNRMASAYSAMGFVRSEGGDWDKAREYSDRCLEVMNLGIPFAQRIVLEYQTGEFTQGKEFVDKSLVSETSPESLHAGALVLGIAIAGRISDDAELFDLVESYAEKMIGLSAVSRGTLMYTSAGSGLAAIHQGDEISGAKQYETLRSEQGTFLMFGSISVDRILGLLAHILGKLDDSQGHFGDAVAFCRKAGHRPELAWSLCDYADMLLERNAEGDHQKAMQLLDESLAISTELGMRPLMERVLSRREILKA